MNTDTEALKALVAKWRHEECLNGLVQRTVDEEVEARALGQCADDLETALERMLASQTQDMGLVPRKVRDAIISDNPSADEARYLLGISEADCKSTLAAAPVASQMGDVIPSLWISATCLISYGVKLSRPLMRPILSRSQKSGRKRTSVPKIA